MSSGERPAGSDETYLGSARVADPESEPTADVAPEAPPRRRRRWRRVLLIIGIVLVVLAGGGTLGGYLYYKSVDSNVKRVQAFDQVPAAQRPQKAEAAKNAMNFLVLGSDTRDPANTGGSRSDTIILLHLNKDHSAAQLLSIPRDTWVHIPKSPNGQYGNTMAKINAAYAWGGVPLTVETIEALTGVRIDHVMMVDFAGFKEIIDALGGVEINVEQAFTSTHSLNANSIRHFNAGPQVMDGAAALDYARERYVFADGDFARIRHQQDVMKAILQKAASGGLLTNPVKLNEFLRATANAVTVDSTLNLLDTAMDLRHLTGANLTFYTNPSKGTGMVGDQSVVFPDTAKDKVYYDAFRNDEPVPASATATN